MEFSTKVNIPKSPISITHADKILLFGSCFAENIGNILKQFQFPVISNPFGIIYNPVSIFNNLNRIIDKQLYTEQELIYHNELYISLDHHGVFSNIDKQNVLDDINAAILEAHEQFNAAKFIIITPGTSFVYHHKGKNKIVANCHKIPNAEFEKRLLTVDEIVATFNEVLPKLKDKTILFTVSPVRHWRDGAIENQRSKSILIESIHQIIGQNKNCFYFPSYEIMMDELRDYRFYADDMLHPNIVSVNYIWKRFGETYFNDQTISINKRIEKINLLLQHRIKNENTKAQEDFTIFIKKAIEDFRKDFPEIITAF